VTKKKDRLPTNSDDIFGANPFSSLETEGLASLPVRSENKAQTVVKVPASELLGKGERLEVRREKSGRGGKTVTTVCGFPSRISQRDFKRMLKGIKSQLGTGGGWRDDQMEIQGDQREFVCEWLYAMGFRPVLAGG
jgi:translation initiation factor 1